MDNTPKILTRVHATRKTLVTLLPFALVLVLAGLLLLVGCRLPLPVPTPRSRSPRVESVSQLPARPALTTFTRDASTLLLRVDGVTSPALASVIVYTGEAILLSSSSAKCVETTVYGWATQDSTVSARRQVVCWSAAGNFGASLTFDRDPSRFPTQLSVTG